MRPTFEDGMYLKYNPNKTIWEGGWLYNISPRSTIQWFSVPNSIGWYAQGINPDGTAGNYRGNLSGAGIGLFGITHHFNKNVSIKLWEQFVENIFNTLLAEFNYMPETIQQKPVFFTGIRFITQQSIHDGGNQNQDKTYMLKGNVAYVFSGRVGLKNKR